jgi:hypothetical protein
MSIETREQAINDYYKALSRGFWHRLFSQLRRRTYRLLSMEAVLNASHVTGQRSIGLRTVCLDAIIGTAGRVNDFDCGFWPRESVKQERWVSISEANYNGVSLPPVELYKIGDDYYVIDGHHRLSVARVQGQQYIEAEVVEMDVVCRQEYLTHGCPA